MNIWIASHEKRMSACDNDLTNDSCDVYPWTQSSEARRRRKHIKSAEGWGKKGSDF